MRWSRFWQRHRRDADLRQELESYLELETANRIAAGMSPADARDAAMRKLGNTTRIREEVYERNSVVTLETLWQDLVYAFRLLRHNKGFAVVAILSVALGIGANSAVFTLLDQVVLRPLPVESPHQLVVMTAEGFQYGNASGDGNELSYPMYQDIRDNNQVFAGTFGRFSVTLDASVRGAGERVRAELVSGSYFPVLGVPPSLGRVFDASDELAAGAHPLVVLSYRYWRDRWQSDPHVVGSTLRVGSVPMTIVGVAREGFDGTNLGAATEIFVPIVMTTELTQIQNATTDRRMRWVNVFGRLKPDVTPEQAGAALQPFYHSRLAFELQQDGFARASARDRERFAQGWIAVTPAAFGKSDLREQLTRPLWTLTAVGVGVLLIACANVANLLLARASTRYREIAVRLAVGATRRRVMRQLLVESLLLAIIGGAAGLVLATWGAQGLLAFFSEPETTLTVSAWPDARILAINVVVSVSIGILFGLAPAWHSTRADVGPVLKSESIGVVGGGYARLRKSLVVIQVAVSMLLLVGAGLFVRSLNNLMAVDTGFDTARLLSFSVSPGATGYEAEPSKAFAKALLERVRATPGVQGAGFVSNGLLTGGSWNTGMTVEGRPYDPNQRALSHNNFVSPGYFDAMGIRLLAGRDFDARDELRQDPASMVPPRTAIANEQFVKQFAIGRNPIGLHIGFGSNPGTPTPIEIIGVVETAKYTSLRSRPLPQLYFPFLEGASIPRLKMYVRTAQPPATLTATMRQVVREIDPQLALYDVSTVEDQVRRSLVNERFVASLSSVLGVLATLLAMIGLYGVMSYTVARRTREIAIRVAFGAVSSRVTALIVSDMLALVAAGMLLALPAFWWLNKYVSSQLYEVQPSDPASLATAAGLLLLAATVAVWVPSRRALRVNPMAALREQ